MRFRRLVVRNDCTTVVVHSRGGNRTIPVMHSIRAGCECVAHAVQAMTDGDGIRFRVTWRHVGRKEDSGGRRRCTSIRDAILWFTPSMYLWEDEEGEPRDTAKRGWSALFALGLFAVQANLCPSERRSWTTYTSSVAERVSDVYASLQHELWRHSRIEVHQGTDAALEQRWSDAVRV